MEGTRGGEEGGAGRGWRGPGEERREELVGVEGPREERREELVGEERRGELVGGRGGEEGGAGRGGGDQGRRGGRSW